MSFTSVSSTEIYDSEQVPIRVCIKKKELIKRGYLDFEQWNSDPNHLYVGRNMSFYVKGALGSPYQNPYKLSEYTRDESLKTYKTYVSLRADLMETLHTILNYKEIGCWCLPGERCHGDVLIEMALEQRQIEEQEY